MNKADQSVLGSEMAQVLLQPIFDVGVVASNRGY